MNFITKNLKQAGIFNTILIAIVLILQVYQMYITSFKAAFQLFNDAFIIVALVSGLFYAFHGYKKSAAKYYKVFMFLSLITFIISTISFVPCFYLRRFSTIVAFIRIIPIGLLAFLKDFGKKNSTICAYIAFVCSFIILIGSIMQFTSNPIYNALSINQVLLSAITIIFVEAKYADKESRGAK